MRHFCIPSGSTFSHRALLPSFFRQDLVKTSLSLYRHSLVTTSSIKVVLYEYLPLKDVAPNSESTSRQQSETWMVIKRMLKDVAPNFESTSRQQSETWMVIKRMLKDVAPNSESTSRQQSETRMFIERMF